MPLFDQMYFDQKWSLWDTFVGGVRNIRGYLITASQRAGNLITAQNRRSRAVTAQKRRGQLKTSGG